MVTQSERNQAVAELLESEVEATAVRARRRAIGASSRYRPPARVGLRSLVVTGVVAAAVIVVSVLAITAPRASSSSPAATAPESAATPIPGEVLAQFSSRDGNSQRKVIAANGSAVKIESECTGRGTISVIVPGGPSASGPCDGATTTASPTSVGGGVTATVEATGDVTWTVSIVAISTHGTGVIFPG